jgi:hypothetical protein
LIGPEGTLCAYDFKKTTIFQHVLNYGDLFQRLNPYGLNSNKGTKRDMAISHLVPLLEFNLPRSGEGREPNEEAMVERLRQFVEKSDLSFYRIASRIGTSGGTLSMWLAGKARPRADELAAIEKLLKG